MPVNHFGAKFAVTVSDHQPPPPPPIKAVLILRQCSSFVWLLRKWVGAQEKSLVFSCSAPQQWTISGGDPLPSLFNVLIANFPLNPPISNPICHFNYLVNSWNLTLERDFSQRYQCNQSCAHLLQSPRITEDSPCPPNLVLFF